MSSWTPSHRTVREIKQQGSARCHADPLERRQVI
jgi:hypothetical protein